MKCSAASWRRKAPRSKGWCRRGKGHCTGSSFWQCGTDYRSSPKWFQYITRDFHNEKAAEGCPAACCGGCQSPLSRTSHAAACPGRGEGRPNVRLPIPIAAFRAQGRLCHLSAINRHNLQLFDPLVGAQQDRWGYRKAERLGGLEVQDHLELDRRRPSTSILPRPNSGYWSCTLLPLRRRCTCRTTAFSAESESRGNRGASLRHWDEQVY